MLKTIKTSELTGTGLNWAVAKCWYGEDYDMNIPLFDDGLIFAPSTNWAHGGPIIEREGISLKQWHGAWVAELEFLPDDDTHYRYGKAAGPTPLIAVMRCYCASKMGDEIDIPEELL